MAATKSPSTAQQFLELVLKSGLVDAKALAAAFPPPHGPPGDPQQCSAELLRLKLLTPFQVKSLLAGRHRGFILGPYKVLEPIGKGGMGVVYLAEHSTLKRRVAVKVLPNEEAADKLNRARFYREARSAAALDHPNIVRLHDVGQGAGVHYLVMEYVQGVTLDALLLKSGALPYEQAVGYVVQAAAGLAHAHGRGFVHRDIKPANLMVSKDGGVKILDMGLARSTGHAEDNLTGQLGDGAVAGTIDYISPEQALNGDVDARSDVYSLGATLFALIAGQVPFAGSTAQKLLAHQASEPPRVSRLKPDVPAKLSDVVAKMMAKLPEHRYQSAEDVIAALSPWIPESADGAALKGSLSTDEMRAVQLMRRAPEPPAREEPRSQGATRRSSKGLLLAVVGVVVLAALGAVAAYIGGLF